MVGEPEPNLRGDEGVLRRKLRNITDTALMALAHNFMAPQLEHRLLESFRRLVGRTNLCHTKGLRQNSPFGGGSGEPWGEATPPSEIANRKWSAVAGAGVTGEFARRQATRPKSRPLALLRGPADGKELHGTPMTKAGSIPDAWPRRWLPCDLVHSAS